MLSSRQLTDAFSTSSHGDWNVKRGEGDALNVAYSDLNMFGTPTVRPFQSTLIYMTKVQIQFKLS